MATENSLEEFVSAVETWQTSRRVEAQAFTLRGFRGFAETMNYHTRKLIALCAKEDPDFWVAMAELANNASTITTKGAKLYADHRDVTNL